MNRVEVGFIVIASVAIIGALILVAVLNEKGVTVAQALFTLALVLVTSIYAMRTAAIAEATKEQAKAAKEQAEASVKIAKETKDARYDALRPIIDIVDMQQMPIALARQAYAKEVPKELPCKLCNVGVGPATDVYSFVCLPSGERQRYNFGTIATGKEKIPPNLSLGQEDDQWFLVAYYKDVYNRWFKSSREVRVGAVNPDPLQIDEINEEELPK